MTVFTEGRHAAEFILSEANGHRSRDNGILKTGENLPAGAVLMDDAGKLVQYEDGTGAEAVGVLIYPTNAAADTAVSYVARDAEVNGKKLTFADTDTSGAIASLAAIGVIVR
jgi:hypothetical protein